MTNVGPWEPQQYYDADGSLELVITPTSTAYNTMLSSTTKGIKQNDPFEGTTELIPIAPAATNAPTMSIPPSEKPNEPQFMTSCALKDDKEEPYYFDPSDNMSDKNRRGHAFHLTTDLTTFVRDAEVDKVLDNLDSEELLGYNEPFDTLAFSMQARATIPEAEKLQPFLAWRPLEVIRRTLENTTQLAQIHHDRILQNHMKLWFPWLNQNRLHKTVATDTMFSSVQDISSRTCAQIY